MIDRLIALRRMQGAAALLLAGFAALAALIAAYVFQYGFGYAPCPLCLKQRWPYYLAIPLALAVGIIAPRLPAWLVDATLIVVALIFATGLALGIYQAGAEWRFWPGPSDCGGAIVEGPASASDLMAAMADNVVVSCTDPAFRFLGLSFAGWNAVVMAVLIGVVLFGLANNRRRW